MTVKPPAPRLVFLDGLRGVAATWVVLAHFYVAHSLDVGLGPVTPAPLDWLLNHATLGVVIFFCLSGYVITHSLAGMRFTLRRAGNFVVRRSVRLDPPYFVTILLIVAVNAASNLFLRERHVPAPSPGYFLAHFVYLQDLIYGGSLMGVFWTLCLEVQLYLTFALALLIGHAFVRDTATPHQLRRAALLAYLPAAALACYWPLALVPDIPRTGWLFSYWHLFVLGVFARWSQDDRLSRALFGLLVVVELLAASRGHALELSGELPADVHAHLDATAGLVVVGVIVLGRVTGGINWWLGSAPIHYLGRISYSLYLTHELSGGRLLNLSTRFGPHTLAGDALRMAVAIGASVAFAQLMYWGVERPFVKLSKRFKQPARGVDA